MSHSRVTFGRNVVVGNGGSVSIDGVTIMGGVAISTSADGTTVITGGGSSFVESTIEVDASAATSVRVECTHGDVKIVAGTTPTKSTLTVRDVAAVPAPAVAHGRVVLHHPIIKGTLYVGANATVYAASTSGDLAVSGECRDVNVRSTSGDVSVSGEVQKIVTTTTSGDVHIDATTRSLEARSTSGDVNVRRLNDEAVANISTVSGDVRVPADLRVKTKTTHGDVDVTNVKNANVSVVTVTGNVRAA